MRFIKAIKSIQFNNDFEVFSTQDYEDTEDKVIITFAEHLPTLKRGMIADLKVNFELTDDSCISCSEYTKEIKDVVLVYIKNKVCLDEHFGTEYVFYK